MNAPAPTTRTIELLTVPEAAKVLKMDPSTVYRMARTGELPHVRTGGSVRIMVNDLNDYILSNRHNGG